MEHTIKKAIKAYNEGFKSCKTIDGYGWKTVLINKNGEYYIYNKHVVRLVKNLEKQNAK